MTDSNQKPWGRVDDTGTVFVRTNEGEREIGQFTDGSPEEALAYFERKYSELAGSVTLLEQRVRNGAPAADVAKAIASLQSTVTGARAVGDLDSLIRRLEALTESAAELSEHQKAEQQAAIAAAITQRTQLVEKAEKLAAQDPQKIQWKQTGEQLDTLFQEWQSQQHDGPRIPKTEANELWKRFRDAKTKLEQHRKTFYAELDVQRRDVRARKERLISRAKALAPKGADGVVEYRTLLDEWKQAGRAGKRIDDTLWVEFKAAGDVLYEAKAVIDAAENAEFQANLEQKLAILDEAETILKETDPKPARTALNRIQDKWDQIGKVPRDKLRNIEDRLRKIENYVRGIESAKWERENPEKKARSEGMAGQLADAIAKLEAELAKAQANGDASTVAKTSEALDARRAWLKAVGG